MQETNNFTNLTRLSSFLLLDMTWNTHLSAKNTERKRNILGDREIDKRRVGKRRRSWTMLAWPNRVQTYTEGSTGSVALLVVNITDGDFGSATMCIIAFALQQWHISGGSSFFTNWAGLFFFCLVSFLSFLCHFLFLFLERDCLLCAICDTWLRAFKRPSKKLVVYHPDRPDFPARPWFFFFFEKNWYTRR